MKQGKGFYLAGQPCGECGEAIPHGTTEKPAYWAYEAGNYYDYRGWNSGRIYYHRSCARRVSKRRADARDAELWEARAYLASLAAGTGKRGKRGK